MMRKWVWNALIAVVKDKTYSNLYLRNHLQEVEPQDRALAVNIFYGTLQNYALCESIWKRYLDPNAKVSLSTSILLTMSVYQLLFLNKVPAYAVVNDAAKLAGPRARGIVNAILRKVADNPKPSYPSDPVQALALSTSLPEWLLRLWIAQYSPKQAFGFAKATTKTYPMVVRINPLRFSKEQADAHPRLEKLQGIWQDDPLYIYKGNDFAHDPLYVEGKISAQDPGSYRIAKWANPKPGQHILDLCAAPGTKTMAMAEMANNEAFFQAQDLHEHRTKLIENDAKRLGLDHIQAIAKDSTQAGQEQYDVVICDVPCTGYGVLGRKPDMKLRLNPDDIDSLLPLQQNLLEAGAAQTKAGGDLIYSTCTLDTKENERQVKAFLERHPEFTLDQEETLEPSDVNGGFYLCRLLKAL